MTVEERQTLARDLARRLNGEPWPYISGHREFYGLDLRVGPRVFIPRPETELLVDLALEQAHELPADRDILIADACTGSGAIAVALAVHLPNARIYATDISTQSLDMAQRNCENHGVADRVTILDTDLMAKVPGGLDIVVSNPPTCRGLSCHTSHGRCERRPWYRWTAATAAWRSFAYCCLRRWAGCAGRGRSSWRCRRSSATPCARCAWRLHRTQRSRSTRTLPDSRGHMRAASVKEAFVSVLTALTWAWRL